jgi:hypothetical protein
VKVPQTILVGKPVLLTEDKNSSSTHSAVEVVGCITKLLLLLLLLL